jgi:[acyl-carrier-protein] S-malonyltransferase
MTDQSKTAFLYPGQGSQEIGMACRPSETVKAAASIFESSTGYASERLGRDLGRLMLHGPKEELDDTRYAQPAILIASITGLTALREILERDADLHVGHSFGHLAAFYGGGHIELDKAIDLAIVRGEAMHEAATDRPGAMAAIFTTARDKALEICKKWGVWVANDNSDTELIISGHETDIDNAVADFRSNGVKTIKLKVKAGAPHTPLVAAAAEKMHHAAQNIHIRIPEKVAVMSSRTVEHLRSASEIRADIAALTESVQWRRTISWLIDDSFKDFYETGPGQRLSKLPQRAPLMKRHMQENNVRMVSLDEALDEFTAQPFTI